MIYRAKSGLQNSKQFGAYSPLHSPTNNRKTSVLKQNKFSPKPSHRENKENLDFKDPKTDRPKEEKYFKISKEQPLSSAKKAQKQPKISISISVNDKKKTIQQFDDINLLNIQTPKFKCSSNKIDDRCKTQHFLQNDNYFSFGNDFRQNIKLNPKQPQILINNQEKKSNLPLREKNKNIQKPSAGFQKFSIDTVKKREKWEKSRQGEERLQQRLVLLERQMKESKISRERQIFGFKK